MNSIPNPSSRCASGDPDARSNRARGYTFALISAAFLSTTAILIRHLTQTYRLPALVLAFWRDLFVVLTLLPVLGLLRGDLLHVQQHHLPYLAGYGFVLAIFNVLWTLSVALNGAAVATVLAYTSAAFTTLLGWWLLKEGLDESKLLAVALSLAGCVMVSGAWQPATWRTGMLGVLTGLLSGLGYAAYSLMGRSASKRGLNPWTSLLYTFGFATLFLLCLNLVPERILPGTAMRPSDFLWLGNALAGWGVLFLLAAVPTVAGFGLYNVSLSYLPSSVANLVVTLEPALTGIVAYLLLGERFSGMQIGGSLILLSSVALLRIREARLAASGDV